MESQEDREYTLRIQSMVAPTRLCDNDSKQKDSDVTDIKIGAIPLLESFFSSGNLRRLEIWESHSLLDHNLPCQID